MDTIDSYEVYNDLVQVLWCYKGDVTDETLKKIEQSNVLEDVGKGLLIGLG